jgi:hypothetical protein
MEERREEREELGSHVGVNNKQGTRAYVVAGP